MLLLTTLENSRNFLILENSGKTGGILNVLGEFLRDPIFVITLAPASVTLGITSIQQNFEHLVEALYKAHCFSSTADFAKSSVLSPCSLNVIFCTSARKLPK